MSLVVARAGGSVIAETPVGAIQGYAGTAAPSGWLLCDGSAVSRTTYSELFGVVSTTYGTGDGSTTFNLPNITGYIIYATRLTTRVTVNNPPEFVTALPSSPLDGKEIYYQSTTAGTGGGSSSMADLGIVWHLRYRSGSSSSYKWEFVGGGKSTQYISTNENTTSTSFTNLATDGPKVTIPLAGDYMASFSVELYNSSSGVYSYASIAVNTTTGSNPDYTFYTPASNATGTIHDVGTVVTCAANDVVRVRYKVSAGTGYFLLRRITVLPVRVG